MKAWGKAPWGRRKIFQSPSHTRPDPCLRLHGRPKWWIGAWKPIWLPRAYLTRGDLEPARGNLHVCKFLRDLTNIQIRTVTAERANLFWVHLPNERVTTEGRKEGENRKEREKDGRKENEGESEREGTANEREREKALDSIRPETNNSVLSWINARISFLLPFAPALDNKLFRQSWPLTQN